MPILRDMPIILNPEAVVAARGERHLRPDLLREAEEAIALGQRLWRAMALYDWFDVQAVDGERIHLLAGRAIRSSAESLVLHLGPKADLLAPAAQVLVSVATIGPALEQQVHELQAAGQGLKAYLLDNVGVLALGAVGEAVRSLAEEAAATRGWGVSPLLSPGALPGWPLQGQRELCALLPLEQIGVQLNEYCVLVPHKSVSALIGLGPGYDTRHVGSICRYCTLRDTCWRRR